MSADDDKKPSEPWVHRSTLSKIGAAVAVPGAGVLGWFASTLLDVEQRIARVETQVERNVHDIEAAIEQADRWHATSLEKFDQVLDGLQEIKTR